MSGTKSCTDSTPSGLNSLVASLILFIHRIPAATKPADSWLLPGTLAHIRGGYDICLFSCCRFPVSLDLD